LQRADLVEQPADLAILVGDAFEQLAMEPFARGFVWSPAYF
jgi:hypothetical protein